MTGPGKFADSNVLPLPHRPEAIVPVRLPTVSQEQWKESLAIICFALAILEKNRAGVETSARDLAVLGEGDVDGLSTFMHQLTESAEQLVTLAALMKSAGARLALVSGREEEWLSLQEELSGDISD